MMYLWKPQMIKFMREASEYSNYNSVLAQHIAKYLKKEYTVCDAGCGLGYLSLALSPYIKSISAIDINESPLKVLRENLKESSVINNIKVLNENIYEYTPEKSFDCVIFNYFGGDNDYFLPLIKRICKGIVIIVKRRSNKHLFAINGSKEDHKCGMEDYLILKNIPYTSEELSIEFGQPFQSIKDAIEFFEIYRRDKSDKAITSEQVIKVLSNTGESKFPYYYPKQKDIKILKINVEDIPYETII